jgi:hypothetical protein
MSVVSPITTPSVVDEEAAADVGAGMDVDAGHEAADVGDEAGRQLDVTPPEPVRESVEQERVHARISQHDLERRARRRVAVEDDADVLLDALPRRARHQASPPRAARSGVAAARLPSL